MHAKNARRYLRQALLAGLLLPGMLAAQADTDSTEAAMDAAFLNDSPGQAAGDAQPLPDAMVWKISGFYESENFAAVGNKKGQSDLVKMESRVRLDARYGNDFFHGRGVFDVYYYPPVGNTVDPQPNGIPETRELYVAWGQKLQFKMGRQLYGWGSADAFKVTNYLDRPDLREMFTKGDDSSTQGVFSFSTKYLFGDYSAEAAFMPVHNSPLLPRKGSFWDFKAPRQRVAIPHPVNPALGLVYDEQIRPQLSRDGALDLDLKNSSAALRIGGVFGNLDSYLSYFYGIDNNLLLTPRVDTSGLDFSALGSGGDVTGDARIFLVPQYRRLHVIGSDNAYSIDKLTARVEAAFSPNKSALDEKALNNGKTKIEEVPWITYTVGADYNLWGEDGRVLVEFTQSYYLDKQDSLIDPFLTNIFLLRIEDKFFDKRLEVTVGGLFRPLEDKPGIVPTAEVGWNFQNGLTVEAGGYLFFSDEDQLLRYFAENDFVYLRAQMTF